MISFTKSALLKIKSLLKMNSERNAGIRIKTNSNGCCNNLVIPVSNDSISDFDKIIYIDNIKVVVKRKDFQKIKDMAIDYEKSFFSGKFNFININKCDTCNNSC